MERDFEIGQKIVYPSQGIGIVKEKLERVFRGEKMMYYRIYIEANDIMVLAPVKKTHDMGLREMAPLDDVNEALASLDEVLPPATSDWKARYQGNLERLKVGRPIDIANVVHNLFNRSKVKELPMQERRLYESARGILIEEIVNALHISAEEAEKRIDEKLRKSEPVRKEEEEEETDDDDGLMGDEEMEEEEAAEDEEDADADEEM